MANTENQTVPPTYWCANFNTADCLKHGLEKKLWMMQYQYSDGHGPTYQGDRKAAIRRNWKQVEQIADGDWLVAYLKPQRFFAIGKVILPRRPKSPDDFSETIDEYLNRQSSHEHASGHVYYTSVFYEDFSDPWRRPDDPLMRYPQRIDVDRWQWLVHDGVSVAGLKDVRLYDLQNAVFRIDEEYFERIKADLVGTGGDAAAFEGGNGRVIEERIQEAAEETFAKSQGFLQDPELRKAIETYAMRAASKFFASQGYTVDDCSASNPYDLCCRKNGRTVYVEVKGTQTAGTEIILTPGEVEFSKSHQPQMALFILHSIKVSAETKTPSAGQQLLISPWNVSNGQLKPISYKYAVG
jgi:Domain of unknown function (DUF3883)